MWALISSRSDVCAGALAASLLRGTDPATIPIRDVLDEVPKRIILNTLALKGLNEPWRVPEEARNMATILVDETGIHDRSANKPDRKAAGSPLALLITLRIPASVLARAQRVIGARPADGLVRGPAK